MKTLKKHIKDNESSLISLNEKLVINKEFKKVVKYNNLHELLCKLLDLLMYDSDGVFSSPVPSKTAKAVINWAKTNKISNFEVIISKTTYEQMLKDYGAAYERYKNDYNIINDEDFNNMYNKYKEKLVINVDKTNSYTAEYIAYDSNTLIHSYYTSDSNFTYKYIVESI